jgi:UDP-N-acetylmuramyl pentapeptide phosphotransferase/UDP-N-acetylglucosamine-1-phosphate transferase
MEGFGIVDVPSHRRAHDKITPRGGGIGLVLIYCIIFPVFEYAYSGAFIYTEKIMPIFVPIALISFWDDVYQVSIPLRLFIHCLCACLAVMWLIHPFSLFHNELPKYLDLIISTFAFVAFLNIYNFLDGIDGISASESIHLSCTILILCALRSDLIPNVGFIIVTVTILLGWSIGFIVFNWQPAKIFLGDAGSISLGFLYGLCLILIATAGDRLFASAAIASLYYIADGGLTIMIRFVNGEKIWEPHLKHFFQKAVKNGKSHAEVVRKIIICNFILMLLAISALYYPIVSIILAVVVVMATLIRLSS